ncbi:MAG: Rrf2 family transcriptional regulator [Ignavibacteriales bacterium]|nr:Rrf2 family transcriptional regulator [Ignavibacteriales bacterium]
MSIIFSRQCEYAIQAVLYLALKPDKNMISIRELTKQLDIPYHFVAKILQDLTRKGLLVSHKGPAGGFGLGMKAKDITLLQIVEAIDGVSFMNNCVFGFPNCTDEDHCAVHDQWGKIRTKIHEMLANKNILEMAAETKKVQYHSGKQ